MTDIYYHESGHAVIAKIFEPFIKTLFVTCDQETSKSHHHNNLGGLRVHLRKKNWEMKAGDHEAIIFVFLAGLCSDAIANSNALPEDFFLMKNWGPALARQKYEGDAEYVGLHFNGLQNHSKDLIWEDYISGALRCICRILQEPVVLEAVLSVRFALIEKKTLNADELSLLFAGIGLQKHIDRKLPLILAYRKNLLNVE